MVRIGRGGESQSQSDSDSAEGDGDSGSDSDGDSPESVWEGIARVVRGSVGRLVELDQGGLTDWARVDKVSDRRSCTSQ